jgi:hypothetical protein
VWTSRFAGLDENHTENGAYCHSRPDHGACAACYDTATREFETLNRDTMVRDNLNSMRFGDFATIALAAFLVAASAGKEVQDIVHCRAYRNSPHGAALPQWHRSLWVVETLRQFSLLPVVVGIVPMLVLHRGADALNLCFNTLAILFMLECDNYAFIALATTARRAAGRLVLDDKVEALMNETKSAHIWYVTASIPVTLFIGDIATAPFRGGWVVPLVPMVFIFLVAGCKEPMADPDVVSKFRGCCQVLRKWLLGILAALVVMGFTVMLNAAGHKMSIASGEIDAAGELRTDAFAGQQVGTFMDPTVRRAHWGGQAPSAFFIVNLLSVRMAVSYGGRAGRLTAKKKRRFSQPIGPGQQVGPRQTAGYGLRLKPGYTRALGGRRGGGCFRRL